MKQQMELYWLENPGGTAKYKEFATVELSGGHWANDDLNYVTPHFTYGYLSAGYMEVMRGGQYEFFVTTTPNEYNNDSPTGIWYQACITQNTDLGRKICKQYESIGYKYADGEL